MIMGTAASRVSRPGQNEYTAGDLEHPVELGEERGFGNASLVEAANPEFVGPQEFQGSLGSEYQPDIEADEQHRWGRVSDGQSGEPLHVMDHECSFLPDPFSQTLVDERVVANRQIRPVVFGG